MMVQNSVNELIIKNYIYCIKNIMKQTHLPKGLNERTQLIKKLEQKLKSRQIKQKQLKVENNSNIAKVEQFNPPIVIPQSQQNKVQITQEQQQIIKLRLKLIGDCAELSVERIQHLQQIFKHYCTHIFKIGKHMTFQRLQYEKVHLTLDRLCVFLKDFSLTTAKIDGIQQQIVDKKQIVRNFKRLSKNCRDLSFQQFIACLQKLAVVYFDQKQLYRQKCLKFKEDRETRIAEYKRKMKQKKKQQQARKKQQNSAQKFDQNAYKDQQNKEQNKNQQKNQQNDDLIQKMMEDEKLQNPVDQVNKAVCFQAQNQFQSEQKSKKKKKKELDRKKMIEQLQFTVEQKVQYFYQMIGVDNVHDFRKKMSQLGLPLFKQYQSHIKQPIHKRSSSTKNTTDLLNIVIQNNDQQDQKRLIELREKLNIKRQRDKHLHSPLISKEEYEQRKRKRQQKQAQIMKQLNLSKVSGITSSTKEKEKEKKKIQIMDKQLSLDMINHLSFQELKNKFDPKKYVHSDQSDQIYLNQYGAQIQSGPTNRHKKNNSGKSMISQKTTAILERKRTSSNIVQDFKKRAYQMEVEQFHREVKLSKFADHMKKQQKRRKQII